MRYCMFFMLFVVTGLVSSVCTKSFAEDKVDGDDYPEIIDIVYEWSPDEGSIQVGDHLILSFKSVWSDNGGSNITETDSQNIQPGDVVKVYLIEKDENDFWLADRIVILAGSSLESAIQNFSENKKLEVANRQKGETRLPANTPLTPAEKPVLENGIWKN